jgi:Rieske Fe-S protein
MDRRRVEVPVCPCSRREFLKTLAAASAAAGLAGCGVPNGPAATSGLGGDVSAGKVADLAVGQLKLVSGAPVILGRDAGGLYAMSTLCTHQGCDMATDGSVDASGAYCACHGSQFDRNGAVVQGPARSPLPHYAVSVDATGLITVHGGQTVAASTRTPVA